MEKFIPSIHYEADKGYGSIEDFKTRNRIWIESNQITDDMLSRFQSLNPDLDQFVGANTASHHNDIGRIITPQSGEEGYWGDWE